MAAHNAFDPRSGSARSGRFDHSPQDSSHHSQSPGQGVDSHFDSALNELAPPRAWQSSRWMGWRLRLLVLLTLLGCIGVFALTSVVIGMRHVDAMWHVNPQGQIELGDSNEPALKAHRAR